MLAFSILATLLCDVIATSSHYNLTQELRSRDTIKGQVPPGGGMTPVVVDVALIPMNILDIDDAKQVVSLPTSLILMWTHPGLAWDSSPEGPYAKLNVLELKTQELWIPKVHILNGASEDRTLDMGSTATVFSNGSVLVSVSPLMKFTCKMDMRVYPFDTQECGLVVFITSTYGAQGRKKKDFIMSSESLIGSFGSNSEWTLENVESEEKEMLAGVSFLVYTLKLRRKTTFYVISFIVPIVLTSYMNTLVFVIPAESGERVSYLVSIFVSNAVFVSFCTDQMPQG
ncbi:neuronal acetylcholine receptor subunit alpha-7-like [Littorina saxatilis]